MESIKELEKYLEDEYYSFAEIAIGNHQQAVEGLVIEKNGNVYDFCSSERGRKTVIRSFSKEQDLVEYALKVLSANKWYKAHLVAWVWTESEIHQAERELTNNDIGFERNDIPNYSQGRTAYRLFVFGRDVAKLTEFKKKYYRKMRFIDGGC